MNLSNIFKMEMYKNFRDKAWLLVIGIMTLLFLVAAVLGIVAIFQVQGIHAGSSETSLVLLMAFEMPLVILLLLGLWVFSIIYPFHLLSTDYNNKVLSLVVASGVKRGTYYFVKLLATILSSLIAYLVMLIIPAILLLGFFHQQFFEGLHSLVKAFNPGDVGLYLLMILIGAISSMVLLYFCVIIARGKFWAIFVDLGINMGLSMVVSLLRSSFLIASPASANSAVVPVTSIIFDLVEIVVFGLIGYLTIAKQDL